MSQNKTILKLTMSRILFFILIGYVVVTQYLIKGYHEELDRLFKVNDSIMSVCVDLSEGDDLE